MAELVREFGEGAVHDELRDAYEHFGVPVISSAEFRAAIVESLEAEHDVAAFYEELAEHVGDDAVREGRPNGWIPEPRWGDTLYLRRRHPMKLGVARLAGIVSEVEPCTARDIKTIEAAEVLPLDLRLRRIALCMAVALSIDPIYMRYQMGLYRLDCGIELDQLEPINSEWAGLVATMNRQQAERPPKWTIEGER
jgi:hypothetical protein